MLASSLRADKSAVNKLLIDASERIGKCAFEMTEKGSCPGKSTCKTPHQQASEKPSRRRICFRELIKTGSCPWGAKCRFSHKITEEERSDKAFVQAQCEEKDRKASKCVNEFRRAGRCTNEGQCPFSHNITEDDRNNEVLKKSMVERENHILNKKKVNTRKSTQEDVIQNPAEFMKGMIALKNEFLELIGKMKAGNAP